MFFVLELSSRKGTLDSMSYSESHSTERFPETHASKCAQNRGATQKMHHSNRPLSRIEPFLITSPQSKNVAKPKFRAVHRLNMLHRGLGSACRYVRACHLECSGSRLYFLQLERREALGLFGEKMEEQLRAAASQEPLMREASEATQQSKRRRLRDMGLSVEGTRGC